MLNQTLSKSNLIRLMKRWESRRFDIRGGKEAVDDAVEMVVASIDDGSFSFSDIQRRVTKKCSIFSSNNIGDVLVQRKLNDNFCRIYKVKQGNRSRIISQISALLAEPTPKFILKMDISKFYEGIRKKTLIEAVANGPLSIQTKKLIRELYSHPKMDGEEGLSRGLSLSASMSEYYMRDFDKQAMNIEGVYYYVRYVDDIIVFCYKHPERVKSEVEKIVEKFGFQLNSRKSQEIAVHDCICEEDCRCSGACRCETNCVCSQELSAMKGKGYFPPSTSAGRLDYFHFDYLGYRFYFPPSNVGPKRKNPVVISISPRKLQKIKSRICASLTKFSIDKDFNDLRDRMRFVTSNYYIGSHEGKRINAGIYYNYPNITLANHEKRQRDVLDDLDNFLQTSIIHSKAGGKAAPFLSKRQKRLLLSMSFRKGFTEKTLYRFSRSKMKVIRKAWINEQNYL